MILKSLKNFYEWVNYLSSKGFGGLSNLEFLFFRINLHSILGVGIFLKINTNLKSVSITIMLYVRNALA
jgi:hypothetical protein